MKKINSVLAATALGLTTVATPVNAQSWASPGYVAPKSQKSVIHHSKKPVHHLTHKRRHAKDRVKDVFNGRTYLEYDPNVSGNLGQRVMNSLFSQNINGPFYLSCNHGNRFGISNLSNPEMVKYINTNLRDKRKENCTIGRVQPPRQNPLTHPTSAYFKADEGTDIGNSNLRFNNLEGPKYVILNPGQTYPTLVYSCSNGECQIRNVLGIDQKTGKILKEGNSSRSVSEKVLALGIINGLNQEGVFKGGLGAVSMAYAIQNGGGVKKGTWNFLQDANLEGYTCSPSSKGLCLTPEEIKNGIGIYADLAYHVAKESMHYKSSNGTFETSNANIKKDWVTVNITDTFARNFLPVNTLNGIYRTNFTDSVPTKDFNRKVNDLEARCKSSKCMYNGVTQILSNQYNGAYGGKK